MPNTKNEKNANNYSCEICNFNSSKMSNYNKHLLTPKHQRLMNPNEKMPSSVYTCECGREYKHMSSLCNHKKKCTYEEHNNVTEDIPTKEPVNDANPDTDVKVLSNTIFELVKQNNEFKQLLIEQNQKMMEMAGNMGNNNNNTVNSHNKFNLNVFLNEKCKNAMTLKDFVKSINISIQDFIETGERGFVDGISNIIVERINEMEIHDRPLHCTDLKRETVYIKDDDKWEKDDDKTKLRKAVKGVAYKNERMRPVWYDSTPDVGIMGTENYENFFKYSKASLGGYGKEETKSFEDKVMKNVLKEVTIDKTNAIE
jgi:hypothetical protein